MIKFLVHSTLQRELRIHVSMSQQFLLILFSPLVVERGGEVVLDFQVIRDDWLKGISHLDPIKEPLPPVAGVKIVFLIIDNR